MKYTFKEHLILEKSVRGVGNIRSYLVNPTGPELISFFSKSKKKCVRFVSSESNLYVWDAYYETHVGFVIKQLLMTSYGTFQLEKKEGGPIILGLIDPFKNSMGTYFSELLQLVKIPSRKWQYTPVLQLYKWMLDEYKDNEIFLQDKDKQNKHILWWEDTFKNYL